MALPVIYNFSWITTETFDIEKLIIGTEKIKQTDRVKFLYKYDDGEPRDLMLTSKLDEKALVHVGATRKDNFTNNSVSVSGDSYSTSFLLQKNNEEHIKMYKIYEQIVDKFKKSIGVEPVFPSKVTQNGERIWCNLISNKAGDVFSTLYSDCEQFDIITFGPFIGRPGIMFSGNVKNGKIKIQLAQAYVYKKSDIFPLSRDF